MLDAGCRLHGTGGMWLLAAAVLVTIASREVLAQDRDDTPATGRQPTISNQFTAASGGAIQTRRPGLAVQQGIALHNGEVEIPGDVPEDVPNFFRDVFDQIMFEILDLISNMLQGLNVLMGGTSDLFGGLTDFSSFIPIGNAATTGPGSSVRIE